MSEQEPLTVRTTSTGVKVIEGDCPHCGHPAMDHWSALTVSHAREVEG